MIKVLLLLILFTLSSCRGNTLGSVEVTPGDGDTPALAGDPATFDALVWFEAKDINGTGIEPTDGSVINTLTDKSGNNIDATLIAGAAGTSGTLSGQKVLQLGSGGYRSIRTLGAVANTDLEVYIVARTRVISASFAFVNENELNGDRYGTHFPWSDSEAYVDVTIADRVNGPWGGNTADIFAWTFRGSTTSGVALERNGVGVLAGGNRTITPALGLWTIGSQYDGLGQYWQADLVAFFVFDKVLEGDERTALFEYIQDNYGVTMTF